MGMLAVFCTNSINILAGINGVEVGQSIVIATSVLLYLMIELVRQICCFEQYIMSACIIMPFIAVAMALYKHNRSALLIWHPNVIKPNVYDGVRICIKCMNNYCYPVLLMRSGILRKGLIAQW